MLARRVFGQFLVLADPRQLQFYANQRFPSSKAFWHQKGVPMEVFWEALGIVFDVFSDVFLAMLFGQLCCAEIGPKMVSRLPKGRQK